MDIGIWLLGIMFNLLHTFIPSSIAFSLFGLNVYWYGLLMMLGGLLGLFIVWWQAPKIKLERAVVWDLAFYFAIGAVIGARIYYVIYAWPMYSSHPIDMLKVWEGGLAVHGVLLGGLIATFIYSKWKKIDWWSLVDLVAIGFVAGQVIGRWGNYFNQEIFGKPTDLPWGIPISLEKRPLGFENFDFFHPTFLYESLANLIIFGGLFLLWQLKIRNKIKLPTGFIFSMYLICYSILRIGLEFLRTDYSPVVLGLRWPIVMSGILFIMGIILIIFQYKKKYEHEEKK